MIPAEDLILLHRLPPDGPQPVALEWINRGTDQRLRRTTISMLMRTLQQDKSPSKSVRKLHRVAGLRFHFRTSDERAKFAAGFRALQREQHQGPVFDAYNMP